MSEIAAAQVSTQQPVKEFFKERGFVQVNRTVNENVNNYPFITCIDANNVAENVYFSPNAGAKVKKGDTVTREMLAEFNVWHGKNADGQDRSKFCLKGENRLDVEDLF